MLTAMTTPRRLATATVTGALALLTLAAPVGAAPANALPVGAAPVNALPVGAAAPLLPVASSTAVPPVVDIVAGPAGFTAPARHTSGFTTLRVTTTDTGDLGTLIGLVRLRPGTTPESFAAHLGQVFSDDRATALAGARALQREADLLAGVQAQVGHPTSVTTLLTPGDYHLLNYVDFERQPPAGAQALHRLTVTHHGHAGVPATPGAAILSVRTSDGPDFRLPERIPAGAPLLVANLLDQVNEAIVVPVAPGTTEADLRAWFEALERGEFPPGPFTGRPVGTPPMSPGRVAVLDLGLTPGRYAVITFVFDLTDGVRLGAKGLHALVTVE